MREKEITLKIGGMHCSACSSRLEKKLNKTAGIRQAVVNLATNQAVLTYVPEEISLNRILEVIDDMGFEGEAADDDKPPRSLSQQRELILFLFALFFAIPLFLNMLGEWFNSYLALALATVVQFVPGSYFYQDAFKAIKNGGLNMSVLVALGTSAAYFYSTWVVFQGASWGIQETYFESSAMVITLVLLGKFLEGKAKKRTSNSLTRLMQLQPPKARIIRDGQEMEIESGQIQIGDLVQIRPGETLPADGIVEKGCSSLDQSALTGESLPVTKQPGDEVLGATINQNGSLLYRVTRAGQETILAQIIQIVEKAQGQKAPIQRMADKISAYFVPVVLGIALLSLAYWYFWGSPGQLAPAILNFTAVIVVACPCALGLATPVSVLVGTGRGAELGILIKGGEYLELTGQIKSLLIDKTGTLTTGQFVITDWQSYGSADVLTLAAAAEKNSEHPLASAILQAAAGRDLPEVSSFQAWPGLGIEANIQGQEVQVGNVRFLEQQNIALDQELIQKWEEEGKTLVLVAINGQLAGILAAADQPHPNTAKAISQLQQMGIKVKMLTGDNWKTAESIAQQVGINEIAAEVLPGEKARLVQEEKNRGCLTAMVGDGINDAPALSSADVGIAFNSGTDIALESASIVIMDNDPEQLVRAIRLSRAALRNIRQNLGWALFYNCLALPLAAAGLLSPIIAGAAMAFSSVSVVSNALRLKKFK